MCPPLVRWEPGWLLSPTRPTPVSAGPVPAAGSCSALSLLPLLPSIRLYTAAIEVVKTNQICPLSHLNCPGPGSSPAGSSAPQPQTPPAPGPLHMLCCLHTFVQMGTEPAPPTLPLLLWAKPSRRGLVCTHQFSIRPWAGLWRGVGPGTVWEHHRLVPSPTERQLQVPLSPASLPQWTCPWCQAHGSCSVISGRCFPWATGRGGSWFISGAPHCLSSDPPR